VSTDIFDIPSTDKMLQIGLLHTTKYIFHFNF